MKAEAVVAKSEVKKIEAPKVNTTALTAKAEQRTLESKNETKPNSTQSLAKHEPKSQEIAKQQQHLIPTTLLKKESPKTTEEPIFKIMNKIEMKAQTKPVLRQTVKETKPVCISVQKAEVKASAPKLVQNAS